MGGTLQVDPADYVAASRTMGTLVAATARSAGDGVTAELAGCHAMAGSDPAGLAWGAQYDPAAVATISATQDAVNAAYQLAALLEQTGFNYSAAEQSSTIGGAPPAVDAVAYGEQRIVLTPPPSASGPNPAALPTAWSLIEGYLHRAWPNGHQDKLRAAAAAWNDSARFLYDASHGVADVVASIARQNSPEREDAITVCTSLRDALEGLGANHNCLSAACADYADELDRAHREAEHELVSLLEWTAGIEVAGAVTSMLTFGLSEVVSQATVIARTSASAARILAIIDRLTALAQDAAQSIELFGVRAGELARTLTPILRTTRVEALLEPVPNVAIGITSTERAQEILHDTATAEHVANVPRISGFRDTKKLTDHFDRHGADFGATSPDDYSAMAAAFFERGRAGEVQVKVDSRGVIRMYDAATNTFASYAPDGYVLTYFKPSGRSYWERQAGS